MGIFIYILFKKRFESLSGITESAEKLKTTVETVEKFSTGILQQIDSMRNIQQNLQEKFTSFFDMLAMKPSTKGIVGEGIVKMILSSLPEECWCEQHQIPDSGKVDFVVHLASIGRILPIDAKFTIPSDLEEEGQLVFLDKEKKKSINNAIRSRISEVVKYIRPEKGTTDFALMFIPDAVYSVLDTDSYNEFRNKRVIPVNTSGLMATIMMVERQYISTKMSEAIEHLDDILRVVNSKFGETSEALKKAEAQARYSHQNIEQAIILLEKAQRTILNKFNILKNPKETTLEKYTEEENIEK